MADYSIIKSLIQQVVKTNGEQEITGANLQNVLVSMINAVASSNNEDFTRINNTIISLLNHSDAEDADIRNDMQELASRLNTNRYGYNVSVFGLVAGVHTLATAVKNVPPAERFGGQKITFKTDAGWVTYQNTSLSVDNYEDVDNWVLDSGVNVEGDVTITNNPDYEDLTQNNQNELKFADKEYSAATFSGLGRVYLRKNIISNKNVLTQAMLADENTIYIIQYDYDLNEAEITIPNNCILKFDGGSLNNGKIIGQRTIIDAELFKVFGEDLELGGSFDGSGFPEWYGCLPNDQDSVCASIAINALYTGFADVQLQSGTYYSKTAQTISVKNLHGKGKVSVLRFNNVTNDFVGVLFGISGGSPSNRAWDRIIDGVSIVLENNSRVRTACIELGATTRSAIYNISLINYNYKTSEFTETEFQNPANYTNYGIMVNGSTELFTMINWSSIADIPIYMKTSSDLLSFISGYGQVGGDYGFAGVYGQPIGTNSRIVDTDFAKGIFGVYSIGHTTAGLGYERYENVRFEQLRSISFTGSTYQDLGSTLYFEANAITARDCVVKDCVLGTNKNAIHVNTKNNYLTLRVSNTRYEVSTVKDYSLLLEGTNAVITFSKCSMSGNVLIPDSYSIQDLEGGQMYGGADVYKLANLNNSVIVPQTGHLSSGRFDIDNKIGYTSRHLTVANTGNSQLIFSVLNGYIFRHVLSYVFDFTVYSSTHYCHAKVLLKPTITDGNLVNTFSSISLISTEGDDIIWAGNGTVPSSKFGVFYSGSAVYIINKGLETLNVDATCYMYADRVLQNIT